MFAFLQSSVLRSGLSHGRSDAAPSATAQLRQALEALASTPLGIDERELASVREGKPAAVSLLDLCRRAADEGAPVEPPSASVSSAPRLTRLAGFDVAAPHRLEIVSRPLSEHFVRAFVRSRLAGHAIDAATLPLHLRDLRRIEAAAAVGAPPPPPALLVRAGALVVCLPPLSVVLLSDGALFFCDAVGEGETEGAVGHVAVHVLRRLEAWCAEATAAATRRGRAGAAGPARGAFMPAALTACLAAIVAHRGTALAVLAAATARVVEALGSGRRPDPSLASEIGLRKNELQTVSNATQALVAAVDEFAGDSAALQAVGCTAELYAALDAFALQLREQASRGGRLFAELEGAESALDMRLDANRNRLLVFEISVLIVSFGLGAANVICAYFGMNMPNPLSRDSSLGFVEVTTISSAAGLLLAFVAIAGVVTIFRRPSQE